MKSTSMIIERIADLKAKLKIRRAELKEIKKKLAVTPDYDVHSSLKRLKRKSNRLKKEKQRIKEITERKLDKIDRINR